MSSQMKNGNTAPSVIEVTSLRDLDALVAQHIFNIEVRSGELGYYRDTDDGGVFIPWYTTDMGAAWAVVERFRFQLTPMVSSKGFFWFVSNPVDFPGAEGTHKSPPLSICLAGLEAVKIKVELNLL